MCDGNQSDDPIEEDDYPNYPDESGEITGNNTTEVPVPSDIIVGETKSTVEPDVENDPTIIDRTVTAEPTSSPPPCMLLNLVIHMNSFIRLLIDH